MSLGMQWRTVQIVVDINTIIVYDFTRSWRQDPSVGSFKQHGKWIFLSDFFFEYLLSNLNPRSQPWKTRCFNEQVIAILVFIYSATKHALCYLCLFWRQWNAYCRASGSSTHFSSALVRLVLFSAQFPPDLKNKKKNIQWNLDNLKSTVSHYCGITSVHPDALANLTNLVELDLSDNKLTQVGYRI